MSPLRGLLPAHAIIARIISALRASKNTDIYAQDKTFIIFICLHMIILNLYTYNHEQVLRHIKK